MILFLHHKKNYKVDLARVSADFERIREWVKQKNLVGNYSRNNFLLNFIL